MLNGSVGFPVLLTRKDVAMVKSVCQILLYCLVFSLCVSPLCVSPLRGEEFRRKVLLIGIDGLRPDRIVEAKAPTLHRWMETGIVVPQVTNTWEENKPRNGQSAPNWASLLTGVLPDRHQIVENGDGTHQIDDDGKNPHATQPVHTVFYHIKQFRPESQTAVINTWDGIGLGPKSILGFCTSTVDFQFRAGKPESISEQDTVNTLRLLELLGRRGDYAQADPDFIFVHLDQTDHAGHSHTWGSPEYLEAIEQIDDLLDRVDKELTARKTRAQEQWLLIVTADHGGPDGGKSHGDNTDPQIRTIPLIFHGDGLNPQAKIATATSRDVLPTLLRYLGCQSHPELPGRVLPILAP